jgi:hypothetical protein
MDGLKWNISAFALDIVQVVVAAAPVIDMTKKTKVKTPSALNIFFCITFPP